MPTSQTQLTGTDDPGSPVASCALDPTGRKSQEARYRTLADTVSSINRTAELLSVRFDEHLDHVVLEQTLTVERECCSFFVFQFDGPQRRLTIGVRQAEQAPALEVLATALTKAHWARIDRGLANVRER